MKKLLVSLAVVTALGSLSVQADEATKVADKATVDKVAVDKTVSDKGNTEVIVTEKQWDIGIGQSWDMTMLEAMYGDDDSSVGLVIGHDSIDEAYIDASATMFLLNGRFEFGAKEQLIRAYFEGGFGFTLSEINTYYGSESDTLLTSMLGAGLSLNFTEKLTGRVGYRHFILSNSDASDNDGDVFFNVSYKF